MTADQSVPGAVAVAIGSNLGDREECLRYALRELERRLHRLRPSSVYGSEPREGARGGDYLNMCAVGVWRDDGAAASPARLLDELRFMEMGAGRPLQRSRGEPRCLDLDLLLFGERRIREPELEVPHPRMANRGFVLRPLAEIAPDWRHPVHGETVAELAAQRADREAVPHPASDELA